MRRRVPHDRRVTTRTSSSCARTACGGRRRCSRCSWWSRPPTCCSRSTRSRRSSRSPTNTFLVFTSNAFAILGLRALYFLLAGVIGRFDYLKVGLAAVLVFVGAKMLAHRPVPRADLGEPARDHPADRRARSATRGATRKPGSSRPDGRWIRDRDGGGGGIRTRVQRFAGACLSHSATPPEAGNGTSLLLVPSGYSAGIRVPTACVLDTSRGTR